MKSNIRMKIDKEIGVGVLLVALLVGVFLFVHSRGVYDNLTPKFELYAAMSKMDGLNPKADVRIAGIKVGSMGEQKLTDDGHQVVIQMVFDHPMQIPADSSVLIESDGIIGAKHLEIVPGGEEEMMASGDKFAYVQDSIILTELMEKVNTYLKQKKEGVVEP